MDPALGSDFQETLHKSLQKKIASDIHVTKMTGGDSGADVFQEVKHRDEVQLRGPESVIGYAGAVRPLDIPGQHAQELADNTAIPLAHIGRF